MKNNIVMVVAELEDGREHIHSKQNKPIKYDLNNKSDLQTIESYFKDYINEKSMCYNKDLTRMWPTEGSPKSERVMVKNIRYEPYVENLHIPYRTFAIMHNKNNPYPKGS
jgi:hypothetical protein